MDKQKKKRIERWFGRLWVNLLIFISRFVTIGRVDRLSRILGYLGYTLVVRHRRAAMRNITLILGKEKSNPELRKIIRSTFIHASSFALDTLYLYTHTLAGEKIIENLVKDVEGLEYLKKASARGKGVIGLGAHLGNFTILGKKLDLLGFSSTAIMRQMKDGKLENMFNTMRVEFGQRWIPKLPVSRAIRESIAWLRKGNLLIVYMDQRSGRGVTVDFMGLPTPTPTGAAVFALKTGAAVLPIVNVKNDDGSYKLIIGEEVPVERTGDHKKDILINTAKFNKVIGEYILRYPDQWFWFHNRWKGINNK
jgi:KDO2-lipid IV(A) lauroyltransferase